MKRIFSSHLASGLLVVAITAVLFTQIAWLAFPLLGLAHGVAIRSLRCCVFGLLASAGVTLLCFILMPVYSDTPPPLTLDYHGPAYAVLLLGSLIGASLPLLHHKLFLTAAFSSIISVGFLVVLGLVLRRMLPTELRMLEMYDYITIIAAVPIIGAGIWWPMDRMLSSNHSIQA